TTTPGQSGVPGGDAMAGMPPQDAGAPPPMMEPPAEGAPAPPPADVGPTGAGWVFKIRAHHYHNEDQQNLGANYVRNTLLKNLALDEIAIPVKDPGKEIPK